MNEGRDLLVVGPGHHTRMFTIDADTLKERLREANSECLPAEMRVTYLGETEESAQDGHDACARTQGRTINSAKDVRP